MSAIDAGIHAIRAGRHLCDEALRYLWTGTSRRYLNLFYALAEQNRISQPLLTRRWMHGYAAPHSSRYESGMMVAIGGIGEGFVSRLGAQGLLVYFVKAEQPLPVLRLLNHRMDWVRIATLE